jgi:hypothetical protein
MSVIIISSDKRYQGLSSDEKPSSVAEGSTFHIVDTGETYVFHNGAWERDLRLIAALRAV